jgi:alpha-L-rhamnosidase
VPAERVGQVLANLVTDVVAHDYHLTTGNVCTKYLLETLADNGRGDVALALARQTSYPSWGYMLANGATTLWERWELLTAYGMNSHNHPMYGSVSSWFYRALAGIRVLPESNGFDRFAIAPCFASGLLSAEASLQTIRGRVRVAWQRAEGVIHLEVEVPPNSEAELSLPLGGAALRRLSSGLHTLDVAE